MGRGGRVVPAARSRPRLDRPVPVWRVGVIAVDVVVIYTLCAHGREGQGCGSMSSARSAAIS
jgi:hypothetical protein